MCVFVHTVSYLLYHCDGRVPPPTVSGPSARYGIGKSRVFDRDTIADAVEQVAPAVVNIAVSTGGKVFGPFMLPGGTSTGSGVIIHSTEAVTHVVTNAHVVNLGPDSTNLTITLTDGRTFPGRVKSIDDDTDLCLIEMDAGTKLHAATLGRSDSLRAGEWSTSKQMLRSTWATLVVQ